MLHDRSNRDGEALVQAAKEYAAGSAGYLRDKQKSFEAFSAAHDLGNIKGTFGLALAWFEGNGTSKDRNKAEELVRGILSAIQDRADDGDPAYQLILGDMYSFGLGKPIDYVRAFGLYALAAMQGCLEAQCNLGYAYLVGQGVEPDMSMTVHWWLKSAEAGYAHSCRDIGDCYLDGNGVARDLARAMYWFQKASDLNYSHGTSALAFCHVAGLGVEPDLERAAVLYRLAYRQDPDRTLRDLLAANVDVDAFLAGGAVVVKVVQWVTDVPEAEYRSGRYLVRASVEGVDPAAFTNCSTLDKFLVDPRNHRFRCIDGVLYNSDATIVVRYPNGRKDEEFVCPASVKRIGTKAFQNARFLRSVTLNEGLVEVEAGAFDDCKGLVQVHFNDGLRIIGPWAFHGCDAVVALRLPASIQTIGEYAFGSCESLSRIEVDEANAEYAALDDCLFDREAKHLLQYAIGKTGRRLEIPVSVETIGFRSCSDAYHLEDIFVGDRVVEVCDKAFYFATGLRRVHFGGPPVARLGRQVFDRTHPELMLLVPASQLQAYKLDERFGDWPIYEEGQAGAVRCE